MSISSSESVMQQVNESAFDVERVETGLLGTVFAGGLRHFPSIDSTNVRALAEAAAGAAAGRVYVADEQTAGRGRGGHTWASAAGDGLYVSVLLRPRLRGADALMLSLLAGVAVYEALLTAAAVTVDLRWPNDVVTLPGPGAASLKLGGILTETAMAADGALRYAVVGVGLNLNRAAFPPAISATATSLRMETGRAVSREAVLVALLVALDQELRGVERPGDAAFAGVRERFTQRSSWVRGKRVRVEEDGGYTGVTDGMDACGLLRVKTDAGDVRTVRHGGVRECID